MDRERYIFEEYIKKQVNKQVNDMLDKQVNDMLDKQVNDMLDKIRAEIERKANSGQWSEAVVFGLNQAIYIIDKHLREVNADES